MRSTIFSINWVGNRLNGNYNRDCHAALTGRTETGVDGRVGN
jgi:hypothetical protein